MANTHLVPYNGLELDVKAVCDLIDEGAEAKDALRSVHPELPPSKVAAALQKVKKSVYYLARKDLKLNILEAKGPELQENLLKLATDARSEMVRFNATDSALDRIYGKKDEQGGEKPRFIFNFSFGDPTGATPSRVTVDSEQS